jgi:hypothetical protein
VRYAGMLAYHKRRATRPGSLDRPLVGSCFTHPRGVETA